MNFLFVSAELYPDQYAAPIRHCTLCKGLVELGHQVRFLTLSKQHWAGATTLDYLGVQFIAFNTYSSTNKIVKRFYELAAIRKANRYIEQCAWKKEVDVLVLLTTTPLPSWLITNNAKAAGINVYHERTELPYVTVPDSIKGRIKLWFYLHKILPRFDGIFVINDKLNEYIKQFNPRTKKLLTVVDLAFFSSTEPSPFDFKYIAYCGQIWGQKDGVPILIEAFSKITELFPALKLVLIGNNNDASLISDTIDAIKKFDIADKVIFTGVIARNRMPVFLCNAEILVVAKPATEQNSGNFPIKIGEYLATGVPIVATRVGEIPQYIKDGESGYLAEPGDVDSFASKMKQALSTPQAATRIGKNGQMIAAQYFDYRIQAAAMANYIKENIHN